MDIYSYAFMKCLKLQKWINDTIYEIFKVEYSL